MNKYTILNILSICVLLLSLSAPSVSACADDECENRGLGYAIAKFEWSGDKYTRDFIEDPYLITVAGNSSTASWTASPSVTGVVVKMGQDYEKYSGGTSGTVHSGDHAISHITFCGRETTTTRATTTTTTTTTSTTTTEATSTTSTSSTTTSSSTTSSSTTSSSTTSSSSSTTSEPTTTTSTTTSTTTTTLCQLTNSNCRAYAASQCDERGRDLEFSQVDPVTCRCKYDCKPRQTTTTTTQSSTTTTQSTTSTSTSTSSTTTTEPSTTTSTTTQATTTTTHPPYSGCCGHSEPPNQAKPKVTSSSGGSGGSVSSTKPSCFDGIKNQDESGVDCGGSCSACMTCSDKIQNQGEEGVDCGGPCSACKVTTTRPRTTSSGSLTSSSVNKSSNMTKPAGDGITTTTLFQRPEATGDVLGNAGTLGRSLLLPLLALLIAYFVVKKRRKTTDEEIVPQ